MLNHNAKVLYPEEHVKDELDKRIGNPGMVKAFFSIFGRYLGEALSGYPFTTAEALEPVADTFEKVFKEWRAWKNPDTNHLGVPWDEFARLRDTVFEVMAWDTDRRVRIIGTCTGRTLEAYQGMVDGEVWAIPVKLDGEVDPCILRREIMSQGVPVVGYGEV